ncbi:hypothetical protein L6452_38538 [Arctium lappa]|uniref:Uncharacterized protein n=1 Tax=Arctium lappa TaxID=4217 RepID=A0ACB8XPD7_ARCLA|nr:hypothetical protein L6452_38538 [Arctium lappa]
MVTKGNGGTSEGLGENSSSNTSDQSPIEPNLVAMQAMQAPEAMHAMHEQPAMGLSMHPPLVQPVGEVGGNSQSESGNVDKGKGIERE